MADTAHAHDASVTRTVELDAQIDDVWEAVSTPELLGGWLEGEVELDVRPGGSGTVVEPDGAVRQVRIDEVEPTRRLALHWWPEDGSSPASSVELDLQATPGGTRLVVTETLAAPRPVWAQASVHGGGHRAQASTATAASAQWDLRLLLLGCALVRVPASCR